MKSSPVVRCVAQPLRWPRAPERSPQVCKRYYTCGRTAGPVERRWWAVRMRQKRPGRRTERRLKGLRRIEHRLRQLRRIIETDSQL